MNTKVKSFIFHPAYRTLRYLAFWVFVMMDELMSIVGLTLPLNADVLFYLAVALDIVFVLVINQVLLPRFLYKKKYLVFTLLVFALIGLNLLIVFGFDNYENGRQEFITDIINSFISTSSIYGMAIGIKLAKNAYLDLEQREKNENERMRSQLNYLKNQVNPHFLFNVLNSLYIQSKANPESVGDTVMLLSDLLRYQIYEATNNDKVGLSKEIEFIKNYLEIEKIRRDHMNIEWKIKGTPNGILIEPLVFLPLIENAVKHSANSNSGLTHIALNWLINHEIIKLVVINNLGDQKQSEEGGFGLKNLQERLQLAYPDHYKLSTKIENDKFIAELTIQL